MKNLVSLIVTGFLSVITLLAQDPSVVPTFECAGFYWKTPEAGPCAIKFREKNQKDWKNGLELVYDSRDGEYRGSIIGLKAATDYEAELSAGKIRKTIDFTTRSDRFPVGKTTILKAGETDSTVVITESGRPDAYHLVTVPEGRSSVLNLKNVFKYGIEIDADYVIVRGIEIRNAQVHGIIIRKKRHDVVIEQCHITFWGRMGGPHTYGNFEGGSDSGIYGENGSGNLTIQRNLIEDPRGASMTGRQATPMVPRAFPLLKVQEEM
jgi:hypothetical protein